MLKAGAALAVIALLALAWFLWTGVAVDMPAKAPAPLTDSPSPGRTETAAPRARPAPVNAGPRDSNAPPDPQAAAQPRQCWEIEDIGEQGLPQHELELIYSAAPMGPHFETYRHLDIASVEAIAAQGDSAAMTLAGLMILGQAFGADTDEVFALIIGEDSAGELFNSVTSPLTDPQAMASYAQAADWFYEAALHGRLGALVLKGFVDLQMQRTAVDLGWVSAAAYEELATSERAVLMPAIVYLSATLQLAPGLAVGTFADEPIHGDAAYEALVNAVHEVMRQYHEDLANRSLPRPAILDADLPAFREAADTMCD